VYAYFMLTIKLCWTV